MRRALYISRRSTEDFRETCAEKVALTRANSAEGFREAHIPVEG
jgi:hypothetical protein